MDLGPLVPTACTVYLADRGGGSLLVLAHGAGAGKDHPFMVTCGRGLAARGVDVVTFDFPYITGKRRVPDRAPVLDACFRSVVATARHHALFRGDRLFIGGKSMGGRIATHLGAAGIDGLAGIVALGYPLHPPRKPEQLRTAHLPALEAPLLIVQGERDTFGTPAELAPVIQEMRAAVTLHVVQGADHSFGVRGRPRAEVHEGVLEAVAAWIAGRYSV